MTDLEAMKLCAEAMSETINEHNGYLFFYGPQYSSQQRNQHYDPLHDDAQAMALVKRFKLDLEPLFVGEEGEWQACQWREDGNGRIHKKNDTDLNRAIVLCVAGMAANGKLPQRRAQEGK